MRYENPNTRVLLDVDREKFIEVLFQAVYALDEICAQ
jgi:hypothetical protein